MSGRLYPPRTKLEYNNVKLNSDEKLFDDDNDNKFMNLVNSRY